MGIYIYLMSTSPINTQAGKIGVLEFSYKDGWNSFNIGQKKIARREAAFETREVPKMVMIGRPLPNEVARVFEWKGPGIVWVDTTNMKQIGTARKVGRTYQFFPLEEVKNV